MTRTFAASSLVLLVLVASGVSVLSAQDFSAKQFADANGQLDRQRAAFYIAHRDKEPLSKFVGPNEAAIDPQKMINILDDKLDDLRSKTGHEAPWTWQELDAAFASTATQPTQPASSPWSIAGITEKKLLGKGGALGSVGPLKLRKNAADLTQSLTDARGANVAYSHNGLKDGSGAFNSAGILAYPSMWNLLQGAEGRSIEAGLDLAASWTVAQVQDDHEKDVEELTFSAPMVFYFSLGDWLGAASKPGAALSNLVLLQGKPYFQTDFGFDYEIYGVEATAEFVGSPLGSPLLYLGGFQNLGSSGLQYQLRLIPKMDYSVTERGGKHTKRKEGDDWLRFGGTASFDLRVRLPAVYALDAGVSYQVLQTVSGSGGFSDLFQGHSTLWLNEHVGLTLEYSKGNTPVANKPIDLLSLGLEFKY